MGFKFFKKIFFIVVSISLALPSFSAEAKTQKRSSSVSSSQKLKGKRSPKASVRQNKKPRRARPPRVTKERKKRTVSLRKTVSAKKTPKVKRASPQKRPPTRANKTKALSQVKRQQTKQQKKVPVSTTKVKVPAYTPPPMAAKRISKVKRASPQKRPPTRANKTKALPQVKAQQTKQQQKVPVSTTKVKVPVYTPPPMPEWTPLNIPAYTPLPMPEWTPLNIPAYTPLPMPEWTPLDIPAYTPLPMPEWTPLDIPAYTPPPMRNWDETLQRIERERLEHEERSTAERLAREEARRQRDEVWRQRGAQAAAELAAMNERHERERLERAERRQNQARRLARAEGPLAVPQRAQEGERHLAELRQQDIQAQLAWAEEDRLAERRRQERQAQLAREEPARLAELRRQERLQERAWIEEKEDREALRLREEEEQRARIAAARLEKENQYATNALMPIVGEGQEGQTVGKLFEELSTAGTKIHNISVFQGLSAPSKEQIIKSVNENIRNGQVAPNKAATSDALIKEAVKTQCTNFINTQARQLRAAGRQPDTIFTDENINCAVELCMEGKAVNFANALGKVKDRLSLIKELSTEDDPISWKDAENISHFINTAKIDDKKIAYNYYCLAENLFTTMNIGPSVEENRRLLLLILKNEEANEPEKLSMIKDQYQEFPERESYAKKHLRAILNSPSPEKYFERLECERLTTAYREEKALRTAHRNFLWEKLTKEEDQTLKFIPKNEENLKEIPLSQDIHNITELYDGLDDNLQQPKFNFANFYLDPNLVYLCHEDDKLPLVVSQDEMVALDQDLNESLTPYLNPGAADEIAELMKAQLLSIEDEEMDEAAKLFSLIRDYANNISTSLLQIEACKNPDRKNKMRARMLRAYAVACEGKDALDPNPLLAKAKFALALAGNEPRCIDGIESWLSDFELEKVYKAPKGAGFSIFVSDLLNQEKLRFISAHQPPATLQRDNANHRYETNPDELAVEGVQLLKQRLRLGFGLPLPYSPPEYGVLGGTSGLHADIYDPTLVVKRFFQGGKITYVQRIAHMITEHSGFWRALDRQSIEFEPFTINRFIGLIRQAWHNKILPDETLSNEIKKDWKLKQAHKEISEEGRIENKYFRAVDSDNPESWKGQYKDAFFNRLLCRYGTVIDETEQDFE